MFQTCYFSLFICYYDLLLIYIMSTAARLADSNGINLSSLILPCSTESLKPARPSWLAKHRGSTVTGSDASAINRTIGKTPPTNYIDLEKKDLESAVATSKAQNIRRRKRKPNTPVRKTSTKRKTKPKKKKTNKKKK